MPKASIDEGIKAFQNRDFLRAIDIFNHEIKRELATVQLFHLKGISHMHLDQIDAARGCFEQLIQLNPENPLGYSAHSHLITSSTNLAEGITLWHEALARFPDNLHIRMGHADALEQIGDPRGRLEYQELIREHPTFFPAYYSLIMVYLSDQKVLEAKHLLYDVLKQITSEQLRPHVLHRYLEALSTSLMHTEMDHLIKLLQTDFSSYPGILILEAKRLYLLGQKDQARHVIYEYKANLVADAQPSFDSLILLGKIYEEFGELDLALNQYRNITAYPGLKHEGFFRESMIQTKLGRLPEATHLVRKALEYAPTNPHLKIHFANLLSRQGKFKKAYEIITTNPRHLKVLKIHQLRILQGTDQLTLLDDIVSTLESNHQDCFTIYHQLILALKYRGEFALIHELLIKCLSTPITYTRDLRMKSLIAFEAQQVLNILSSIYINSSYCIDEASLLKIKYDLVAFAHHQNLIGFEGIQPDLTKINDILKSDLTEKQEDSFWNITGYFLGKLGKIKNQFHKAFLYTYEDLDEALEIANILKQRIKDKIPTSFIRLGDGEAMFLPYPESWLSYKVIDQKQIQKIWWGEQRLKGKSLEQVTTLLKGAIANADILGIPSTNRIIRSLNHCQLPPQGRELRALDVIFNYLLQRISPADKKQILTSCHIHTDLSFWNLYGYIFQGLDQCTLITCRRGLDDVIKSHYEIKKVHTLLIPGESAYRDEQDQRSGGVHYPDIFDSILNDFEFKKGHVYLVAAGFLGKIYCQRIKSRGGIGLDIGAMADYWMGIKTRHADINPHPIADLTFHYDAAAMKSYTPNLKAHQSAKKHGLVPLYLFQRKAPFVGYAFSLDRTEPMLGEHKGYKYVTFYYVHSAAAKGLSEFLVYRSRDYRNFRMVKARSNFRSLLDLFNRKWSLHCRFFATVDPVDLKYTQPLRIEKMSEPERLLIIINPQGTPIDTPEYFYPVSDLHHNGIIKRNNTFWEKNNIKSPIISIVMTYFNRKSQLLFTLKTIMQSQFDKNKLEIIIVDDNSFQEHRLEDVINDFEMPIKLLHISQAFKAEKNYKNPGILYNFGFMEASGETLIIQNPEVCHVGDVLSYTAANIKENEYLAFTCANLPDSSLNEVIDSFTENDFPEKSEKLIQDLHAKHFNSSKLWYNHQQYRPEALHFLTAIRKKQLDSIGGFDQIYAEGYCFEDNDLIWRIKQAHIQVKFVPFAGHPFGIHQWHPKFTNLRDDFDLLRSKNYRIYQRRLSAMMQEENEI